MARKAVDQVKCALGAADINLAAKAGEAFMVKRIFILPDTGTYLTVSIGKTTVGYFRVDKTYGNHLPWPKQYDTALTLTPLMPQNLLDLLTQKGIFAGYPVAEGEVFSLNVAGETNAQMACIYDIYEAADIKPEQPNGSRALEYMLVNYGDTGAAIATPGDHLYDNPVTPLEFPQFPFGDDVPPKHQITIHGILGAEVGVRNATPETAIYSQYLKLIKERTVLFDEDKYGLPFNFLLVSGAAGTKRSGGFSVIGDYSSLDPRLPLFLTEPIVSEQGDELNIYVTVVEPADGSSIAQAYQTIALIETVKKITA